MKFAMLGHRMVLAFSLSLAAATASAAPVGYRLQVDGLACPFCAYGIEKKLGVLEGVQRVETRIKDGAVIVIMRDGATLDEATLKRAVKDAGFSLRKIEQVEPDTRGRDEDDE